MKRRHRVSRSELKVRVGQIWSRPALTGDFTNIPVPKGMRKRFIVVDVGTTYAVVKNDPPGKREQTRGIKLSRLLADSGYQLERDVDDIPPRGLMWNGKLAVTGE